LNKKSKETWTLDQLLKSRLFHRKLHEWGLLEIAREIEEIKGEQFNWDKSQLYISDSAWNKVIHRGIKPVTVFAHPNVLINNPSRVSYYRMLAMVSQKSMDNVGIPTAKYEEGKEKFLPQDLALQIARHLNGIISDLVDADDVIDPREFDLWRGMAAGTQAQGSWQNEKGIEAARVIAEILIKRIKSKNLISTILSESKFHLKDGRELVIGREPDIGFYDRTGKILIAVEIKGGIDTAGVLERLGAALKSLSRAKRENPQSLTILVVPSVAATETFKRDVKAAKDVDHYFAHEELVNNPSKQEEFFNLLSL